MKLATYKDGSRDGQLVVVSHDLALAHYATGRATRLQQALDDWNFVSPQLQDLYVTLNQGKARHAFPFDPRLCLAPLPRAFQYVDAAAYPPHLERLHHARATDRADMLGAEPPMAQRGSDDFLGPCDDAWFAREDWDIDFGAGLAVVTGDVAQGADAAQALDGVRLLVLVNGWCLRALEAAERARGSGLLLSRPAPAFGPVAVTPDELGEAWQGGRARLTLHSAVDGRPPGRTDAATDMRFHFGELIAHLARTRSLRAGSLIGSGTVSNADPARGFGCIAERRAAEIAERGEPRTAYLAIGERVRIEVTLPDGQSLFGAIDQRIAGPVAEPADGPAAPAVPPDDRAAGPSAG